ncbi:hypothetical protein [Pseudomonas nicosulfuronedens]
MTQSHSAPAPAGSEHRVNPTALALHVASATSWGRPWRRRALSLPTPQALTFQGIWLPFQPLRSWLHLLSGAGMLGTHPPADIISREPEDDENVPSGMQEFGVSLSSESVPDFARFRSGLDSPADDSRMEAGIETPDDGASLADVSSAGVDELPAPGIADGLPRDSLPHSLNAATATQENSKPAPTPPSQAEVLPAPRELQAPEDESEVDPITARQGASTVAERQELAAEKTAQEVLDRVAEMTSPKAIAPAQSPQSEIVEPVPTKHLTDQAAQSAESAVAPFQEVTHHEMPEMEAPVVTTEIEPGHEPEAEASEAVAESEVDRDAVAERPHEEVSDQHETRVSAAVMQGAPAAAEQPEKVVADARILHPTREAASAGDFGFEPMIASLEDALAVLATASGIHDEASTKQATRTTQSINAPLAAEARLADDSTLEAALQGIFIQKETEMTDMRDEPTLADAQSSAPITSVELQEVAATLSVPQLEADPDDVLTDVQSTLNSLAGMAQGLTQQKQAAGRLQEELEERNSQLQERERHASDKEERLQQLENHLKEAKTNLDRMAAENNRLLAERSEALKELAQTVDLRDKTTVKRAEAIQLEQQRIDEQLANLRNRASELDDRESTLKRKSEELGVRLKQLQSAKDKFSAIVKSFNETVQFNSTLSAISKTVNE